MLSFFPSDVLDEIFDLTGSVSEDFPTYSTLGTGSGSGRVMIWDQRKHV